MYSSLVWKKWDFTIGAMVCTYLLSLISFTLFVGAEVDRSLAIRVLGQDLGNFWFAKKSMKFLRNNQLEVMRRGLWMIWRKKFNVKAVKKMRLAREGEDEKRKLMGFQLGLCFKKNWRAKYIYIRLHVSMLATLKGKKH